MVSALQQGNEALRRMQKAVSLEAVEQLMEDNAEARAYQEELQRALGESWTAEDDGATEAALAALESEVAREEAAELPAVPERPVAAIETPAEEELPAVPAHVPGEKAAARAAPQRLPAS